MGKWELTGIKMGGETISDITVLDLDYSMIFEFRADDTVKITFEMDGEEGSLTVKYIQDGNTITITDFGGESLVLTMEGNKLLLDTDVESITMTMIFTKTS